MSRGLERLAWVAWLLCSTGCTGGKESGDSATFRAPSPCADGTWGALDDPSTDWDSADPDPMDPETAIHVRADGDDANDGSLDAPVATLDRALSLSRLRDTDKVIFVGPGTYTGVAVSLSDAPTEGGTDDGLTLAACRDEVTLEAGDDADQIVRISSATGVRLYDLTLQGGTRALWIWDGAEVSLARVHVKGSGALGVVMDGPDTVVDITHLDISDTRDEDGGNGLAIGAGINKATVRWSKGTVSRSRTVGVFFDGDGRYGMLELTGVSVVETSANDDGLYGRGVQIQDAVSATLTDCEVSDAVDAGVFVLQAGSTTLDGLVVSGVATGSIPGSQDTSGDGIVVTSDDGSGESYDPSLYTTSILNSTLGGFVRAGVLVEDVSATISGNAATGGTLGLVSQGTATTSGSDTVDALGEGVQLNRASLDETRILSE